MDMVTLPAGHYLIGDLCYQDRNEWDQMINPFEEGVVKTLSDGRKYVILNTRHGDGCYQDQDGKDYFVDSGTIGIIEYTGDLNSDLGRTFDFGSDFQVYSYDGVLHFGAMYVDTDYRDYDDNGVDYEESDRRGVLIWINF